MYTKASGKKYYYAVAHYEHQLKYGILTLFNKDIKQFYPQIESFFENHNERLLDKDEQKKVVTKQITIYKLSGEIIEMILKDNPEYMNLKSKFILDVIEINKILHDLCIQQAISEVDKKTYIKKAFTQHKKLEMNTESDYFKYGEAVCGRRKFYSKGDNYDTVTARVLEQLREDLDFGTDLSDSHGIPNPTNTKNDYILSDKMIKQAKRQWHKDNK